jgi:hypothetical protein
MRGLNKTKLHESEDEYEKFVSDYYKKKIRIGKQLPTIVSFLTNALDDYSLYNITTDKKRVRFGSTYGYNKDTGVEETFSDDKHIIILRFINLSSSRQREVKVKVYEYMRNMFGINLIEYGNPVDVEYINLIENKF